MTTQEIDVYRVTETRTCVHRGDPSIVVLRVSCGDMQTHLLFDRADFARFARQVHDDARLLGAQS